MKQINYIYQFIIINTLKRLSKNLDLRYEIFRLLLCMKQMLNLLLYKNHSDWGHLQTLRSEQLAGFILRKRSWRLCQYGGGEDDRILFDTFSWGAALKQQQNLLQPASQPQNFVSMLQTFSVSWRPKGCFYSVDFWLYRRSSESLNYFRILIIIRDIKNTRFTNKEHLSKVNICKTTTTVIRSGKER